MLLVLPPSETKRDGGAGGSALRIDTLAFPELTPQRAATLSSLKALSRNLTAATGALGLGPTQRFEVDRNRVVATSPVLPALDRYTGVLYDGLDVTTLSAEERAFAHSHVLVHSALFGLIRAGDLIPAYRLSHNSRLPGLSLRKVWREPISTILAEYNGLVLDLRSEAYASLGPAPTTGRYLRVVTENAAGRRVALSHFNKKAKGEFTRAVIAASIEHPDADSLVEWCRAVGIRLEPGAPGELDLIT